MAFRVCTDEANKGNVVSERLLAGLYDKSQVPGHDAEAVTWYRKAAEKDYAPAQSNLGYMYAYGFGVERDERQAVKLYTKAAQRGFAPAIDNLGEMYLHGNGIAQDVSEAIRLFEKAAAKGSAGAANNLGWCYEHGTGVAQNPAEAAKWYRIAANAGVAQAQYNLGILYLQGRGIAQNDAEAQAWFARAAQRGFQPAQCFFPTGSVQSHPRRFLEQSTSLVCLERQRGIHQPLSKDGIGALREPGLRQQLINILQAH